ncbi:tyrosine-type recombinase/integrase [Pseudomonas promysalinigenes]|uniref:tyrosine-type recombinase/integrase n=1 Tax=Pseudomonas promysalinigenes TaxID=485898 RepID=UPI00391733CD
MDKAQRYLTAGTRENTRKSYRAAIEHFEVSWGGYLPTTAEGIVRYLAEYADTLALSTLRQRLAALAQWHVSQGFPDPTKTAQVRQMLKGIRVLHPIQQKQAAPLQLRHLEKAVDRLERKAGEAIELGDYRALMRSRRDVALLLIGFWRGFRSDELARLQVEDTQAEAGVGITFYLPYTKADRAHAGTTFHTPALKKLCPVEAYINWITVAGITRGPVFRKLDRWGNLSEKGFKASSLIPLLRRILEDADIPAQAYSSHSMRRGFATWASANGWDIKGLMSYVGWRDMKSALRYVEAINSFGSLAVTDSRIKKLEHDH